MLAAPETAATLKKDWAVGSGARGVQGRCRAVLMLLHKALRLLEPRGSIPSTRCQPARLRRGAGSHVAPCSLHAAPMSGSQPHTSP